MDISKPANSKHTLLDLQKKTDRINVSRDGKIAVTVKRELSVITSTPTRAVVDIYERDAGEEGCYSVVQSFDFELNSRGRYSLAVNGDGCAIAIGLPSNGTNGHGEVRIRYLTPGSVGWKVWCVLDNDGKKGFGRNVGFNHKGLLQVHHDCGYAYYDALSGRAVMQPSDKTKGQHTSDGFLEALKKKKEETTKLRIEGENVVSLQRVRNTELEQEIDLLNNLIELYSKKKP